MADPELGFFVPIGEKQRGSLRSIAPGTRFDCGRLSGDGKDNANSWAETSFLLMARHETDREDLMREATALRERVELRMAGELEPVFAGWRADGRFSLYFGADPAFHFDADGSLRRAFLEGDLYRSQGSTLAKLRRTRTATETTLLRHDLDSRELEQFFAKLRERLMALRAAIETGAIEGCREVPAGGNLVRRLRDEIAQVRLECLALPLTRRPNRS